MLQPTSLFYLFTCFLNLCTEPKTSIGKRNEGKSNQKGKVLQLDGWLYSLLCYHNLWIMMHHMNSSCKSARSTLPLIVDPFKSDFKMYHWPTCFIPPSKTYESNACIHFPRYILFCPHYVFFVEDNFIWIKNINN